MNRILCIDYGDRRIGLAVSDPLGYTAQPIGYLKVSGRNDAVSQIKVFLKEKDIKKIVFGLPKNMDGSEGGSANKVRDFAEFLSSQTDIEMDFYDERMTTICAEKTLNSLNVKGRKKVGKLDTLSAVIILQSYLAKKEREN